MTVTTHPPCTIEIPSVESEWIVIGGVGRGIHCHLCVHTYWQVCVHVHTYVVGSPLLQFLLLSLFSVHSVIDGESNAAHQCSASSLT